MTDDAASQGLDPAFSDPPPPQEGQPILQRGRGITHLSPAFPMRPPSFVPGSPQGAGPNEVFPADPDLTATWGPPMAQPRPFKVQTEKGLDTWEAAMAQSRISWFPQLLMRAWEKTYPEVEGFDSLSPENLKDHYHLAHMLALAKSPDESNAIKERYRVNEQLREMVDRDGGFWSGGLAMLTLPETYVGGPAVKAMGFFYGAAVSAGVNAGLTLGAGMVHSRVDPYHDIREDVASAKYAAIFGGLIGGAFGVWGKKNAAQLGEQFKNEHVRQDRILGEVPPERPLTVEERAARRAQEVVELEMERAALRRGETIPGRTEPGIGPGPAATRPPGQETQIDPALQGTAEPRGSGKPVDPYDNVVTFVRENDIGSASRIQRQFRFTQEELAATMKRLEDDGILTRADARGARTVMPFEKTEPLAGSPPPLAGAPAAGPVPTAPPVAGVTATADLLAPAERMVTLDVKPFKVAPTGTTKVGLAPAFGLEKVVGEMTPLMRMSSSGIRAVSDYANAIFGEMGVKLAQNLEGIATPQSALMRSKFWVAAATDVTTRLEQIWNKSLGHGDGIQFGGLNLTATGERIMDASRKASFGLLQKRQKATFHEFQEWIMRSHTPEGLKVPDEAPEYLKPFIKEAIPHVRDFFDNANVQAVRSGAISTSEGYRRAFLSWMERRKFLDAEVQQLEALATRDGTQQNTLDQLKKALQRIDDRLTGEDLRNIGNTDIALADKINSIMAAGEQRRAKALTLRDQINEQIRTRVEAQLAVYADLIQKMETRGLTPKQQKYFDSLEAQFGDKRIELQAQIDTLNALELNKTVVPEAEQRLIDFFAKSMPSEMDEILDGLNWSGTSDEVRELANEVLLDAIERGLIDEATSIRIAGEFEKLMARTPTVDIQLGIKPVKVEGDVVVRRGMPAQEPPPAPKAEEPPAAPAPTERAPEAPPAPKAEAPPPREIPPPAPRPEVDLSRYDARQRERISASLKWGEERGILDEVEELAAMESLGPSQMVAAMNRLPLEGTMIDKELFFQDMMRGLGIPPTFGGAIEHARFSGWQTLYKERNAERIQAQRLAKQEATEAARAAKAAEPPKAEPKPEAPRPPDDEAPPPDESSMTGEGGDRRALEDLGLGDEIPAPEPTKLDQDLESFKEGKGKPIPRIVVERRDPMVGTPKQEQLLQKLDEIINGPLLTENQRNYVNLLQSKLQRGVIEYTGPEGEKFYLPRKWILEKVVAGRDDLEKILADHYASQQIENPENVARLHVNAIIQSMDPRAVDDLTAGQGKFVASFLMRTVDIPNAKVSAFIENDVGFLMRDYAQHAGISIEFAKQFGDPLAKQALEDVLIQAAREGVPAKELAKIEKVLEFIRNDALGVVRKGQPLTLGHVSAELAKNYTGLAYMGDVARTAMIEVARPMMTRGFSDTLGFFFHHYLGDRTTMKTVGRQMRRIMNEGMDVASGMASARYNEFLDMSNMRPGSYAAQLAKAITDPVNNFARSHFYVMNGLSHVTDFLKNYTMLMSSHFMIEDIRAVAAGTASAKRASNLLAYGIDKEMADLIMTMPIQKTSRGLNVANIGEWNAANPKGGLALGAYANAVQAEVRRTIVSPGQGDKSMIERGFLGTKADGTVREVPWLTPVFQFMSWGLAANQKVALSALQGRDANAFGGAAAMVGMGFLILKWKTDDRTWEKMSWPDKMLAAVEKSGILGSISDLNNRIETGSRNTYGARPLLGLQPFGGRYTDEAGQWGAIGPSFGLARSLYELHANPYLTREQQGSIVRRATMLNTLFYLKDLSRGVQHTLYDPQGY